MSAGVEKYTRTPRSAGLVIILAEFSGRVRKEAPQFKIFSERPIFSPVN